jgi:hypothetical protein
MSAATTMRITNVTLGLSLELAKLLPVIWSGRLARRYPPGASYARPFG